MTDLLALAALACMRAVLAAASCAFRCSSITRRSSSGSFCMYAVDTMYKQRLGVVDHGMHNSCNAHAKPIAQPDWYRMNQQAHELLHVTMRLIVLTE